ncbi:MAG: ankyrin repeat domain-containing protein [Pedococcus sp.]
MELDPEGRTDLHYAAAAGNRVEAAQLLATGYDVALADVDGFTPLHLAAQYQRADVVPLLVAAGAPLEARDQWGNTPLWRAVSSSRGRTESICALLEAGADPDTENNHGTSPRTAALRIADYDVVQHFVGTSSRRAS